MTDVITQKKKKDIPALYNDANQYPHPNAMLKKNLAERKLLATKGLLSAHWSQCEVVLTPDTLVMLVYKLCLMDCLVRKSMLTTYFQWVGCVAGGAVFHRMRRTKRTSHINRIWSIITE